jgi:hypothetical protein
VDMSDLDLLAEFEDIGNNSSLYEGTNICQTLMMYSICSNIFPDV